MKIKTLNEVRPGSNSDGDALQRLNAKLEKLEAERALNNAINKIVRRKLKAEYTEEKGEELRKLDLSDQVITEIFKPDFCGDVGIPAYINQNLGGNIKRVKERIAELESAKGAEIVEIDLPGEVKLVFDPDEIRVYFEFPGKPDDDMRALLKSKGFRWTPSKGHWGRKLTANAIGSAKMVKQALQEKEGA